MSRSLVVPRPLRAQEPLYLGLRNHPQSVIKLLLAETYSTPGCQLKNKPSKHLQSRILEFALCRFRGKLPCLSALKPRFVLTGGCTESQCGSFRYRSSAAGAPLGGNEDSNWERKETIRL